MCHNLPISALVVTYNEDRYLKECLQSISYCDEIVVVDLGSEDKSIEIAQKYATKIVHHQRVPVVEEIRVKYDQFVKNDWVMFIDPDESFTPELKKEIVELYNEDLNNVALIRVPWLFYFKDKPLFTTFWSDKSKGIILNTKRSIINKEVHRGYTVKKAFSVRTLTNRNAYLRHNWMISYRQLLEKHLRYIKVEGPAMLAKGHSYKGRKKQIRDAWEAFEFSFIQKKGWRGGLKGWFLSLFYAWYTFMRFESLRNS